MAHADGQMPSEMALLVGAEKGTLVEGLSWERSSAGALWVPGCNLYTSWALTLEPAGVGSFLPARGTKVAQAPRICHRQGLGACGR